MVPPVTDISLFAPDPEFVPEKPPSDQLVLLRVMITVKAAPNPSEQYGETVCVAGIRLDPENAGWVRLYPINFRELDGQASFSKYDIVSVQARPNRGDPRGESWRPAMTTLRREGHLRDWSRRWPYLADHISDSMCGLLAGVRDHPPARSLAAIRPREVTDLDVEPHPGWTSADQAKIDRYMGQLELPGLTKTPRTALEAPRFKGWYRYRCASPQCSGHRQGIHDWEWVALQRNLVGRGDASIRAGLRSKFLDEMCAPDRDVIFYVGNQQRHQQSFMVLGLFWPRSPGRR
jgi:hypothetical protein